MSQHDGVLADLDGGSFLSDLNAFIAAYLSRFSGTTDPATLVAYQQFVRTDLGVAYRRNAANSANLLDDTLADTLVVAKSGTFAAGIADFKRTFVCTGTWDATFSAAATLGDGWYAAYKNNGSGVITFNPNGAETIDSVATLALAAGQSCIVYSDGVSLYTIGVLGIPQATADIIGKKVAELFWHGGLDVPAGALRVPVSATNLSRASYPEYWAAIHKESTVTITIASPGVVSWTAHGRNNGDPIVLSTTGALPTGLTAGTTYYIVNKAADTFQLSATVGGAAINTSGSQSGVHTAVCAPFGVGDGSTTFGMHYLAADYTLVQGNANELQTTVGQVIAHSHALGQTTTLAGGSTWPLAVSGTGLNTSSTGGSANLAAGLRAALYVQYKLA